MGNRLSASAELSGRSSAARRGSIALSLLVCALLAACGSSGAEGPPPQAPSGPGAVEPAAGSADAPSESLAKDSTAASPAEPAAADAKADAPAADKAPSSQAPREVEYRVTPEGLVIAVDGVTMKPRAKSVKIKGGWGVEVTVEVTADKLRFFSNPENGPLSFAGNIVRKKESTRFGDERKGDDVMNVAPGAPKTFSRTFPGKGQQPLWWGEVLELEAGLWGLGNDADRRPLKKLFKLKMEAREGAQPLISPPDV